MLLLDNIGIKDLNFDMIEGSGGGTNKLDIVMLK